LISNTTYINTDIISDRIIQHSVYIIMYVINIERLLVKNRLWNLMIYKRL